MSRASFGDTRFEVEWCKELAFYEDSTDVDRDKCKMSREALSTLEEAKEFSEHIYKESEQDNKFGMVEVNEMQYESYGDEQFPWLGRWTYVGVPMFFTGDGWE